MKTEKYTAAVVTVSDKGAAGLREDKSGPLAADKLAEWGFDVVSTGIIPDERDIIERRLIELSDKGIRLIITSGGTGASPRDITPEATMAVSEREMPGLSELMRFKGYDITPYAVLSRGRSVIRKGSLIINLPGNPKAVGENLDILKPVLAHAIKMLEGRDTEH